jgi:hypothetical protein
VSARGAGLRCVGVTTSYPASALVDAELLVGGLHELTIPMLEHLVATENPAEAGPHSGTEHPAKAGLHGTKEIGA